MDEEGGVRVKVHKLETLDPLSALCGMRPRRNRGFEATGDVHDVTCERCRALIQRRVIPEQLSDGSWRVGEKIFASNAQAWRWIDREGNEPVSRAEDVSDWVFNKLANGE